MPNNNSVEGAGAVTGSANQVLRDPREISEAYYHRYVQQQQELANHYAGHPLETQSILFNNSLQRQNENYGTAPYSYQEYNSQVFTGAPIRDSRYSTHTGNINYQYVNQNAPVLPSFYSSDIDRQSFMATIASVPYSSMQYLNSNGSLSQYSPHENSIQISYQGMAFQQALLQYIPQPISRIDSSAIPVFERVDIDWGYCPREEPATIHNGFTKWSQKVNKQMKGIKND